MVGSWTMVQKIGSYHRYYIQMMLSVCWIREDIEQNAKPNASRILHKLQLWEITLSQNLNFLTFTLSLTMRHIFYCPRDFLYCPSNKIYRGSIWQCMLFKPRIYTLHSVHLMALLYIKFLRFFWYLKLQI